jgi:hypothetical protein
VAHQHPKDLLIRRHRDDEKLNNDNIPIAGAGQQLNFRLA